MDLIREIKKVVKGKVTNDSALLDKYSRDASLFRIEPKAVVTPKDSKDLQSLVKFVSEQKKSGRALSLTARSGGTDMSGAAVGDSIVVDMQASFSRIKKITRNGAVVEPGVYYRDFDRETQQKNLILPSFPASRELCTVGGMVANNAGGELNLLYGKTERYVQELRMVCADGREYSFGPLSLDELQAKQAQDDFEGDLYRKMWSLIDRNYDLIQAARPDVSKNSAGYYLWNVYDKQAGVFDLSKVIVGSQGTLGLITEIKLGLVRPNQYQDLFVIFLKDLNAVPQIVNRLLPFAPQSIESYDDQTLKVAMKFLPSIIKRMKGRFFKLFFRFLPEAWMALSAGLPKLVLLVEFAGKTEVEVRERILAAKKNLEDLHLQTKLVLADEEEQKYWIVRRESFNLLRAHVRGYRTAPFIDDFVVKPEVLPEFLPKLYAILNKYQLNYTVAGHVGDGNFHIIPLMKQNDRNAAVTIQKLGGEVYELVFAYKGSMTGEHNDGLVRGPYLKQMFGPEVYKLFGETKKIFDPYSIFNPGKKVNSSMSYAIKHLDFK